MRSAKHGTKNSEASSFVKKGGHDKKMILARGLNHACGSLLGFTKQWIYETSFSSSLLLNLLRAEKIS